MKSMFIFPPNWSTSHPYMSIPCIIPYIKKNGFDVSALDLNLLSTQYFISDLFLDKCLKRIKKLIKDDNKLIKKYDLIHDFLISQRRRVENILHIPELFFDYEKYIFAGLYRAESKLFRNVAYFGNEGLSLNNYKTMSDIFEIINNLEINYYSQFYHDKLNEYIDDSIDIVLMSLAGIDQLIPTLTLCKYIKEYYPKIKIILGGNTFTKIKNKIDDSWNIMFEELFDYILLYEGEYVVSNLLKCIEEKGDIFRIPNCVHYTNGYVNINEEDLNIVDIENGFAPDFTDYCLHDYSSPYKILPYYVERGCYWKKCTFCDHDFGFKDCYRIKSIDKVIADIKEYIKLYNVKFIHFVDEAIPPVFIEKMCHALIKNGIQIKWFTCIKASKKFTKNLCQLMKKAGCVFVSIGVESCCQNVLNKMNKGISIEDIELTLRFMRMANIWVHAFLINDFEGETYKNKFETFAFVNKHKDLFVSVGIGNFTLSKNAKIFNSIQLTDENTPLSDFTNDYLYKSKTSLDKDEFIALKDAYKNLNYTSKFFSDFIFEREHIAVFMSENDEIINSKYLSNLIEPLILYNKKYIITYMEDNILYVYNLINRRFFILPKEFSAILESFDGNLNNLKKVECMTIFNNKEEIIDFIYNQLYV